MGKWRGEEKGEWRGKKGEGREGKVMEESANISLVRRPCPKHRNFAVSLGKPLVEEKTLTRSPAAAETADRTVLESQPSPKSNDFKD